MRGAAVTERRGILLVLSGPSGTGKSTLIRMLRTEFPRISFSVSITTRPPRPGEVDGSDYRFVDTSTFQELRDQGEFAEWAEVHENYYGTPLQPTLDLLLEGRDVIFDIDVKGARQLKRNLPGGCSVFVLPPSRQALEERLAKRSTDDAATVGRRLENARHEIAAADEFDYWIVNSDLQQAYDQLRAVYLAEQTRPHYHRQALADILASWEDGRG